MTKAEADVQELDFFTDPELFVHTHPHDHCRRRRKPVVRGPFVDVVTITGYDERSHPLVEIASGVRGS